MDKTIKFRAWNGEHILYPEFFGSNSFGSKGSITIGWTNQGYIDLGVIRKEPYKAYESCILMQFTGLYDYKGKEIWEGDIIVLMNKSKITKKEYWYPKYVIEHDGWSFSLKYNGGGKNIDCPEFNLKHCNQAKVIGNIYEHPQLLDNES